MRFVKLAVNATSAGLCLFLDRTGHTESPLSTLANLSLALSVFVLVVAALHELVQGRAELIRETQRKCRVGDKYCRSTENALAAPCDNRKGYAPEVVTEERRDKRLPYESRAEEPHIIIRP